MIDLCMVSMMHAFFHKGSCAVADLQAPEDHESLLPGNYSGTEYLSAPGDDPDARTAGARLLNDLV